MQANIHESYRAVSLTLEKISLYAICLLAYKPHYSILE